MQIKYNDIKILEENISSFKATSIDSDNGITPKYMTDSEIKVINFDKVKDCYIKDMKLSYTPCSSDALYISKDEKIYFVEFKNGKMTKEKVYNVYNKIYDSLLIFNDIVNKNISFCRENVNFVLVYNESKNSDQDGELKQEDSSKAKIGKYFYAKAKKKYVRFDLDRFKTIYFQDVFTYTESEFANIFLADKT